MTAAWLLAAGVAALAADGLLLRGGRQTPPGQVVAVELDGVRIGPPSDVVVGWDIIDRVPDVWLDRARAHAAHADALWRGRARFERGDFAGAERALEPLLPGVRGTSGPAARLVSEALLRCRLERGARASAVDAWLVWAASVQAAAPAWLDSGQPRNARDNPTPTADAATLLAPGLPPIWLDVPAIRPLGSLPGHDSGGIVPRLADAYRVSARFEGGTTPTSAELDALGEGLGAGPLTQLDGPQAGLRLVSAVVLARVGESDQRARARAVLQSLTDARPEPWAEAWCRVALGRSLLREDDAERRLAGVLELLHIPARLAESDPYLLGLALAQAAVALRDMGDQASASRLFDEFSALPAEHPAWAWAPIRHWRRPPAGAATPDAGFSPDQLPAEELQGVPPR